MGAAMIAPMIAFASSDITFSNVKRTRSLSHSGVNLRQLGH
jgi:hypothetical protein